MPQKKIVEGCGQRILQNVCLYTSVDVIEYILYSIIILIKKLQEFLIFVGKRISST